MEDAREAVDTTSDQAAKSPPLPFYDLESLPALGVRDLPTPSVADVGGRAPHSGAVAKPWAGPDDGSQVKLLEQQVMELERLLSQSEFQRATLEKDLARAWKRCEELQARNSNDGEICDLQHQLAALASENDSLRSLTDPTKVQQRSNSDFSGDASGGRGYPADQQARHRHEIQRRIDAETRLVSEMQLRTEAEDRLRKMCDRQESDEKSRREEVAEKDRQARDLKRLLMEMHTLVRALQGSHVQETMDFAATIQQVKREQVVFAEALTNLETADGLNTAGLALDLQGYISKLSHSERQLQGSCENLTSQCKDLETKHQEAQSRERSLRQILDKRQELKSMRKHRWTSYNIAIQMFVATTGCTVQEVRPTGKLREVNIMVRSLVGQRAALTWKPRSMLPGRISVGLDQVLLIGFGHSARGWLLNEGLRPELCFSIYTLKGIYDFVSTDDRIVEAFVLALSKLCSDARGYTVPGSMHSHTRFILASARSKLQTVCFRKGISLATLLIQGAARAHLMRPAVASTRESRSPSRDASRVSQAGSPTHREDKPPSRWPSRAMAKEEYPRRQLQALAAEDRPRHRSSPALQDEFLLDDSSADSY